jgi:plastocyanin
MKALTALTGLAFACGGILGAAAADHVITQKGKVFSESEVTVKAGESLVFTNDDSVAHNILSTTPGNEFNLGAQEPGTSTPVVFKAAGDVKVMCAIHPRMQLMVKVEK